VNPLLLFSARASSRRQSRLLRRQVVDIPDDSPGTDIVFLVLRQMRTPLVVLVAIFAISVWGLSLMPGQDPDGNPHNLSIFDAFYVISYTAPTIGFGEIPYPFTIAQRMWVTGTIYASVIGWAYALGMLFELLQESAFRDAVGTQQFRRRVRRIAEPFVILSGFGHAGRLVSRGLDEAGVPFVVVDGQRSRIDVLTADQLELDPPGIHGDLSDPTLLGLAGLGHPDCEGVIALTDDNDVNLATVMAVHLLRPEVPVIARCTDPHIEERMHEFAATAVINPYDRFGGYLLVALQRPATYQLVTWLMSPLGSPLPEPRSGLAAGRWMVCAEGDFGREIVNDLTRAGLDVTAVDPADGDPDLAGFDGFIAGTERDAVNIALAMHARLDNPHIYLVVRIKQHTNAPLLTALDVDFVFMPTDLVSREILARVVTPTFWSFVEHTLEQPEEWAEQLLARLTEHCGTRTPDRSRVEISAKGAPAVHRRLLAGEAFTLHDLMRDPDDRDRTLSVVPLLLLREGGTRFSPTLGIELQVGDVILFAGRPRAHGEMAATLEQDTVAHYLATGEQLRTTWLWRRFSRRSGALPAAP